MTGKVSAVVPIIEGLIQSQGAESVCVPVAVIELFGFDPDHVFGLVEASYPFQSLSTFALFCLVLIFPSILLYYSSLQTQLYLHPLWRDIRSRRKC